MGYSISYKEYNLTGCNHQKNTTHMEFQVSIGLNYGVGLGFGDHGLGLRVEYPEIGGPFFGGSP